MSYLKGKKKQKDFINTLNKLVAKGWIERYENNYYKIHPLIKLVILEKLHPNFNECVSIFNNLIEIFDDYISSDGSVNFVESREYLSYCDELLRYFQGYDKTELCILLNNTSLIENKLALFNEAISANERVLKILERIEQKTNLTDAILAQTFGYLMVTYTNLDINIKAIEYGEKCLIIQEKILPSTHHDLATTYNNLSNLCKRTNQYELGVSYSNKAVVVFRNMLIEEHSSRVVSNLVNAYLNLANATAEIGRRDCNEKLFQASFVF